MYLGNAAIQAQTCTNPVLFLVNTSAECNEYDLRIQNPPFDLLTGINITVDLSSNAAGTIQAQLSATMAQAGGFNLSVDHSTIARINLQRLLLSGFSLPSPDQNNILTLFSFTFSGPPGSTVTADIDNSAVILLKDLSPINPNLIGVECSPSFQNQSVSCGFEGANLSGRITAIQNCAGSINNGLEGVDVTITSTSLPGLHPCVAVTDNAGDFTCEITPGEDYLITPTFNQSDPGCGVDAADLVVISGHLLGTFPFTNPWQFVAADFDVSNSVTNLDQIYIQRAILFGLFPENFKSWRIAAGDGLLGTILNFNLATVRESIEVNDVMEDVGNNNFIGVKLGDVQTSCTACIAERSQDIQYASLHLSPAAEKVGDVIEIVLSAPEHLNNLLLYGLELAIDQEHLQLLDVKGFGGFELKEDAYILEAQKGYFRSIWIPLEGEALELAANDQLILEVAIKKDFESLNDLIHLLPNSHFFPGLEEVVWQLQPVKEAELSNIWPNPFGNYLHLQAFPEIDYQVQILDSRGLVLYEKDNSSSQERLLSTANWPAGVYYYKIRLGNQLQSGKLIKQ